MRLRNKLILVIIISLLVQIVVSSVFTLYTFVEQSRLALNNELYSGWDRVHAFLENIKHNHFIQLFNLKKYIEFNLEESVTADVWLPVVDFFEKNIEYSQIVIMDGNGTIIKNSSLKFLDKRRIRVMAAAYDYNYTINRYFINTSQNGLKELYLISGTKIIAPYNANISYFVFFIRRIDQNLTNVIAQELGVNTAFYYDSQFICSSIPFFEIYPADSLNTFSSIETDVGSYDLYAKVLSTDLKEQVYLIVLISSLNTVLYLTKLITSFVIAFILTLIVSILFATTMTSIFTNPFTRLQQWLDRYMKTGSLKDLTIKTNDEIGFLARSFYTIADKVLKEEAIIKNQLSKITFLNEYNENILSNMQAGVIVLDAESKIEYCNNYMNGLLNAKDNELINTPIYDLLIRNFITQKNIEVLKKNDIKTYKQIPNIVYEKPGADKMNFILKIIPLWVSGQKVKTLLVLEDITKTERFWEKMAQADKIASLGLLSAGMAHEINNPLGSIISHVQYLTAVEKDPEKLDSIKWIQSETQRIADLIQKLLSFARDDQRIMEKTDVKIAILEILSFMKHDLNNRNIQVVTDFAGPLPEVELSSSKLKQVIFNIVLNAADAIGNDGSLTLKTRMQQNGKSKDFVSIEISDTGKGIPASEIQRIFDPFFTSKSSQRGTGLGLSICYSIISKAGGEIKVLSSSASGTTFAVLLRY